MKSVWNIAKAELRYMATSPIAWGVTFVMLLFFAKDYIAVMMTYVGQVERGKLLDDLTAMITLKCQFAALMKKPFYITSKFVLPFVFMGVISREFSAGTMRLIQSSPVSVRTFVWGKFVGLMGYSAVLVLTYSLLVVVFTFSVESPEIGLLVWQLTVVLLYYFFIAAVCLFASSLSPYAIVGGVVAVILIVGTNLLNNVGQGTAWGDFFYPLSHQGIAERLVTGGIDWNDVIVLLVFTVLFVQLAVFHLQHKERALASGKRTLRFGLLLVCAFVLIAALPYKPIHFTDIRREHVASVHPNMQKMLGELNEGPLEVTHYFNIIFPVDMRKDFYVPEGRPDTKYKTWRPYMRHKKDINVNVKYYYALDTADHYTQMLVKAYQGKSEEEIARIMCDTYGYDFDEVMTLDEAQQEVDITGNEYIGHIVKLAYQGKETEVLGPGFFLPDDRHYYAAMQRLVTDQTTEIIFVRDGKPRELYYKTHESEYLTNKQANLSLQNWLQIGPVQDSIWLEHADLPSGTKSIVLAGPRQPLADTALDRIKQFIDKGGNLLLAGEPAYREYVKPVMDYLGIGMKPGVIIQPTPNMGSARLLGYFATESYPWFRSIQKGEKRNAFFGQPTDTANLILDGAMALDISGVNGFQVTPVIYSRSGRSWNKPVVYNFDSLQLILDRQPSDEDGSFLMMTLLHREVNGRQQRILVSGDVDFLKGHNAFGPIEEAAGFEFLTDVLTVFTDGEFPVDVSPPLLPDKAFKVTVNGVRKQELALVYVLPALLIIGGAYTILRRRRK